MLFFALPFSFAFGAALFSVFYFQRKTYSKAGKIEIASFYEKTQNVAVTHLYRVYRIAAIIGLPVSLVLFFIPGFSTAASLGFLMGVASAVIILHIFFIYISKLDARFIDRSSYGLIQSFNLIFGGGNMLGVFLLASALFVILVYYVILGPSSIGLVSLGVGVSVVASLFKAYSALLLEKNNFKTTKEIVSDPGILSSALARLHAIESVVRMADILETFSLALITAILGASLIFPGFAGAIALPLLAAVGGIVSAAITTKLIHVGATTNISKNIFFSLTGSVVLSSVVAFPAILWAMNENVQYSNAMLWLSMVLGFSALFFIFASRHNLYLKKLFLTLHPPAVAFIFAIVVAASYWLAGAYGFFLLIVSMLSLGGVVIAIYITGSSCWRAQLAADNLELPQERRNIMKKLNSISRNLASDVDAYIFLTTVLVASGLFALYQKEAEYALVNVSLSLTNPHVVAGIFTGIASAFIFIKMMEYLSAQEVSFDNTEPQKKPNFAQRILLEPKSIEALKRMGFLMSLVYITPLVVSFIFGVEFFSGFFYGILVSAVTVYIMPAIYNTKRDLSFDTSAGNTYSNNTVAGPLSFLKAIGAVSLLIIIFIL